MFSYRYSPPDKKNHKIKKGQETVTLRIKTFVKFFRWVDAVCKKISACLFSGRNPKVKGYRGSMTVEAAFVLPLCLYAIVNLLSITEIYRLQSNLSASMHKTAKEMAVYAHEIDTNSTLIGSVYAANKVKNDLGEEYLDHSPLAGGAWGINWLSSEFMRSDCIDLVAAYHVKPAFGLMGFEGIPMCNRIRTRAWTGYDNARASLEIDAELLVYITPNGKAYHFSKSCSYLKLSIQAVDMEQVSGLRNKDGSIYYACEECGDACKSTVFITDYGNRYHSTLKCTGLKRTIYAVPLSEAAGRSPCSKCGGS